MGFVELNDVVKVFGRHTAVDDFCLSVEEGEFVSFLGGSGCGKTTTLRMIAGFETPTSGRIRIDGADVVDVPPNRRGVGMVFQNYALFPNMTAGQNIGFGLQGGQAATPEEIERRVGEMLALIHMEEFRGRYPHQMSGGQQQRVALARALAVQPRRAAPRRAALGARCEDPRPPARRDPRHPAEARHHDDLRHPRPGGGPLHLGRIVVMREGRIEQAGTPFEIYNQPATAFVASFVGSLNVLDATVVDAARGRLLVDGQEIRAAGPVPHRQRRCGAAVGAARDHRAPQRIFRRTIT